MTVRRSNGGQQGLDQRTQKHAGRFFPSGVSSFRAREMLLDSGHENIFAHIRGRDLDFRLCHALTQRCLLQRGR